MANKIRKTAPLKNAFNPNGAYKWEPTDEFVLSGAEFDVLYNILHKLTFTNEHIPAQVITAGYNALFNLIKTGYEQGFVKELPSAATSAPAS